MWDGGARKAAAGAALTVLALAVVAGCSLDFDRFRPAFESAAVDAGEPPDATIAEVIADRHDETIFSVDGGRPGDAASCLDGMTFGGHCYFLTSAAASWDLARVACQNASAHLVTFTSAPEQTAGGMLGAAQDRWIGLTRPAGSSPVPASFQWITGETSTYGNWDSGEPGATGTCVRLRADSRWADGACAMLLFAICERE